MTSSWIDANHPGTLLSNVHYGAFGLSGSTLGNGLTETATYNSLGKVASFTAAQNGTTRYNFGLGYAADGQISSASDSQNGNWTYTYDPFNRLKTASKTGQAFQWDYDRYGNRWHQTVTQGSGGQSSLSFSANNNQVDGETYDAAGNVTHVGTRAYTYDAENRVTSVAGDTTASYVYDAEGRRIKTQVFEYLYNLDGRPIALLNASTGANIYDEIYAGGRHLATYSGSVTNFDHTDWLGTERVRTGPTGTVSETCTSLPFGDGQTCTGTEWSYLHFTGDEHDYETGLDHTLFRQYQSLEARWLSVDPLGGDISDPQSLNRYAYVENDPVSFSDPFGLLGVLPAQIGATPDFLAFLELRYMEVGLHMQANYSLTQGYPDSFFTGFAYPNGTGFNLVLFLLNWNLGTPMTTSDFKDINCGITVKCRPVETANLGKAGFQHCDAQVRDKSGSMHSLSGGPADNYNGTILEAWDTSPPITPFTGTIIYQGGNCSVAACAINSTHQWNKSPNKPIYHPIVGPNSNTWLKGTFAGCGADLRIGVWGGKLY